MHHNPDDYDDPEILSEWLEEQREHVLEYLEEEGISHDDIEECLPNEPDFCVAPFLAVWAVMDPETQEEVEYWVISGDLPTDYVSAEDAGDVREVLMHFSKMWTEVAGFMKEGKEHPDMVMGPAETWAEMAPLLENRAEILRAYAEADEIWEDDEESEEEL